MVSPRPRVTGDNITKMMLNKTKVLRENKELDKKGAAIFWSNLTKGKGLIWRGQGFNVKVLDNIRRV